MISQGTNIFFLENRPVLISALEQSVRGMFPGPVTRVTHYDEIPKKIPSHSLLFLSVQLLPVDVPIPSSKEQVASVVYGENFTSNCANWWIERGALGVWDLRDSFETIELRIRSALAGEVFKSPTVEKLTNGAEPRHGMHLLSRRELQVAKRLVQGNSTREVAKELGVTEGTIKNQRKAVYRKLGIVRSSQLPLAMGNGFAAFRA